MPLCGSRRAVDGRAVLGLFCLPKVDDLLANLRWFAGTKASVEPRALTLYQTLAGKIGSLRADDEVHRHVRHQLARRVRAPTLNRGKRQRRATATAQLGVLRRGRIVCDRAGSLRFVYVGALPHLSFAVER